MVTLKKKCALVKGRRRINIVFMLSILRCPECDFAASKRGALDRHVKLRHDGKAESEAGNTKG